MSVFFYSQEQILTMLAEIRQEVRQHGRMLREILEQRSSAAPWPAEDIEGLFHLPMANGQSFKDVEMLLETKENFKKMVYLINFIFMLTL
jgi:hypothetical protein